MWNLPQTLKQLRRRACDEPKEFHILTDQGEEWAVDDSHEIEDAKEALERLEFQRQMETEALDIAMLSEAFSKLPKLLTLCFEYTVCPPGSWDLAQMGFEVYDPGIPWRCHVFQTFLQALAKAECQPQGILWHNEGLQLENDAEALPIWAFNDLNLLIDQQQMSRLLSNLRVLHIERTWYPGYEAFALDDILPDCALGNFLELCPRLEELFISFGFIHNGCTNRHLMGRKPHKNLRKLTFWNMSIDLDELIQCLVRNKSLELLSLDTVTLASGGWPTFLNRLRGIPLRRLRSLDLLDLRTSSREGEILGWLNNEQDLLDYIHGKTQTNPYSLEVEGEEEEEED